MRRAEALGAIAWRPGKAGQPDLCGELQSSALGRPVRGNAKMIQELEADFHGAGWNVIK
jgi:hypothetical protein